METLTPEQINNWRQIIAMTLESRMPGAGLYAYVMPESEVIVYWQKMKATLEHSPKLKEIKEVVIPVKCRHENTITGNCGTYCLDCEIYI